MPRNSRPGGSASQWNPESSGPVWVKGEALPRLGPGSAKRLPAVGYGITGLVSQGVKLIAAPLALLQPG